MASNGRIEKFSPWARFTHWSHVASFFLLGLTGLVLYYQPLNGLAILFGGQKAATLIHRIAAVVFVVIPVISLFKSGGEFGKFLKEILTWDEDDKKFIKVFYRKFLGLPQELPPQGRFNAGQKMNAVVILIGCTLMAISGFAMWFFDALPLALTRWMYLCHDLGAMVLLGAGIMHGYLAAVHPDSKASLEAMTQGSLSEDFAKHHHYKWYMEQKKG